MSIQLEKVTAKCVDCGTQMTGNLKLGVADWMHGTAQTAGSLFISCARHHSRRRHRYGQQGAEHSTFNVYINNKRVGTMHNVASFGSGCLFTITGQELLRQFRKELQQERKSSGHWHPRGRKKGK